MQTDLETKWHLDEQDFGPLNIQLAWPWYLPKRLRSQETNFVSHRLVIPFSSVLGQPPVSSHSACAGPTL